MTDEIVLYDEMMDNDSDGLLLEDANWQVAQLLQSWEKRYNTTIEGALLTGSRSNRYGLSWDMGRGAKFIAKVDVNNFINQLSDTINFNGYLKVFVDNGHLYAVSDDHDGKTSTVVNLISSQRMERRQINEYVHNNGLSPEAELYITGKKVPEGSLFSKKIIATLAEFAPLDEDDEVMA